jgi:hypothetical protein
MLMPVAVQYNPEKHHTSNGRVPGGGVPVAREYSHRASATGVMKKPAARDSTVSILYACESGRYPHWNDWTLNDCS